MTTLDTRPATATPAGTPYDQLRVVPARHPGRWLATGVVAVLLAMVVHSLVTNPRWEWDVVGAYLTEESIVRGVLTTVELTAITAVLGFALGTVLALMRVAGLEPVDVEYHQNDSDVTLALQSGRVELYFGPNATAAYKAATAPEDFQVVGTVNGGWPATAQIAIATAKGNGLAKTFTAALNGAIADGSYREVLDRWGLWSEAVERSETNPPGLAAG